MATVDVKLPVDWLRTSDITTRSDLLEARKQDRRELAFAIEPPLSGDKKFARSDRLYRGTHRPNGALARSPRQQELEPPPQHYHPRATCSGSPTKAALVARRQHDKRLESLKFQPSEVERLRDIPKDHQLENWWKRPAGYVEDPAFFKDSLRLQLTHNSTKLGSVDPAKSRSPASVDERRLLREKRAQLADKVTHITHQMPEDFTRIDSEAVDVHLQERRANGISSFDPARSLPMSPIKVPMKKKAPRRAVENLVLESTSQRVLLDQFKSCQLSAPRTLSANAVHEGNTAALLSPIKPVSQSPREGNAFKHSVRCGGFS